MSTDERLRRLIVDAKAVIISLEKDNTARGFQRGSDKERGEMQDAGSGGAHLDPCLKLQIVPNEKWYKTIDGVRIVLEVITFAIAIWFGRIYYGQWQAAEKQIAEMQKQRMLDERAWVVPFEYREVQSDQFQVFYKNTGRTPALNVVASYIGVTTDTNEIISTNHPVMDLPFSGLLAPNSPGNTCSLPVFFSKPIGAMAYARKYFYGRITYDDIFGKHHWTTFCVYQYGENGFAAWTLHNSCDDSVTSKSK